MPKRCYYDILGVDISVSRDTLKNVYKKLALKWHPDKNIGNEEDAREQFLIIQEAFRVLSDPHERAWYDSHRDQILSDATEETESFNIFPYFSASCYTGFGDDDKGFYAVYRTVFQKIDEEDQVFAGRGEVAPTFGESQSPYHEVVEVFYAYWCSYLTKNTYAWAGDKVVREYGRRVNKMIDKTNQKLRDSLKKERNEEIRNLVEFVKKRDRRVIAWSKKMQLLKQEKMQKTEKRRLEQLQQNLKQNESYEECSWSSFSALESELEDIERTINEQFIDKNANSDESIEEDDTEEAASSSKSTSFYCVACKKLFQSEKAFANHENSKKHKQNAALLASL